MRRIAYGTFRQGGTQNFVNVAYFDAMLFRLTDVNLLNTAVPSASAFPTQCGLLQFKAMEPIIYLVRHAESEHNISKDFSHRDPPLTASGVAQASALETTFPDPGSIAIVFTSQLKRALQTTLAGFSKVLAVQHTDKSNAVDTYAKLVIDVDLQERSDLLCDTGSDRAALEEAFPALDFSALGRGWFAKTGFYSADETSVKLSAETFRKKLWGTVESLQGEVPRKPRSVVIVAHGVFMKYLSQDMSIDLPKAAWRAFRIRRSTTGGFILIPA